MRVLALLVVVVAAALTESVDAGQHLVAPGDPWDRLGEIARPGDEIILMPGRHRPARLIGLRGTGGKPITIRGLTPDRPSIIDADREGLRLEGPRHVVIRDVTITGASINGITVSPPRDTAGAPEPWLAELRIENVAVTRTGPEGKRHAIQLAYVSEVRLEGCVIQGWGGAAVDIARSRRIELNGCRFGGLPDHGQRSAVQVRGGCDLVMISNCTMVEPGDFALLIGGDGESDADLPYSARPIETGEPAEPAYQASRVHVLRTRIQGSACPLGFLSATDCLVRNVTIVRPRLWVMAVDAAAPNAPLPPSRRISIRNNLIAWEPGDLKHLVKTGPRFVPESLVYDRNLWWSPEDAESRQALGDLPGTKHSEQIMDLDPGLDEAFRPKVEAAMLFGADAP